MNVDQKLIGKFFNMKDGGDVHKAKVIGIHDNFYIYETYMWNGEPTKPHLATLEELKGKEPMSYRPYNK